MSWGWEEKIHGADNLGQPREKSIYRNSDWYHVHGGNRKISEDVDCYRERRGGVADNIRYERIKKMSLLLLIRAQISSQEDRLCLILSRL